MTNAAIHHTLVQKAVRAGAVTLEKSANATDHVSDLINAAWPTAEDGLSKVASLARILSIGVSIEEAEAVG
jgi:hypothetical protein